MNIDSAVFYSHNIENVVSFYTDLLGFTVQYKTDQFVSFIFSNKARLGIKNSIEEREMPGHQTVFIGVDNIESRYNKYKATAGLTIHKELIKKQWGQEFTILDPDKNKVLFIQRQPASK